jgi:hypothetical protein
LSIALNPQQNISNDEAIQIATGWLKDNNLPAHLSVQKPVLDQSDACWHMIIHINDAEESNQIVGELSVDSNTGKVIDHSSVEAIIQRTAESDFTAEVLTAARRFMDNHTELLSRLAK